MYRAPHAPIPTTAEATPGGGRRRFGGSAGSGGRREDRRRRTLFRLVPHRGALTQLWGSIVRGGTTHKSYGTGYFADAPSGVPARSPAGSRCRLPGCSVDSPCARADDRAPDPGGGAGRPLVRRVRPGDGRVPAGRTRRHPRGAHGPRPARGGARRHPLAARGARHLSRHRHRLARAGRRPAPGPIDRRARRPAHRQWAADPPAVDRGRLPVDPRAARHRHVRRPRHRTAPAGRDVAAAPAPGPGRGHRRAARGPRRVAGSRQRPSATSSPSPTGPRSPRASGPRTRPWIRRPVRAPCRSARRRASSS